MVSEIPLRLLPLRATVKRFDAVSGEYSTTVYTNLPCRLANHWDYQGFTQERISSDIENAMFICRYLFSSAVVDIRLEDRIIIGSQNYRVLKVTNAESANHHFEITVQHFKTVRTQA